MSRHPLHEMWANASPWPAALQAARAPSEQGLMPHQELAAQVAAQTLRQLPGLLLASPVGAGKTRTALRVAELLGLPPSILCPASLRPMWQAELGGHGEVLSYDALLHRKLPERPLWICDEAHELRNPDTRRHQSVAGLDGATKLLLLTATPVQNRLADLTALLDLFVSDATALAITGRRLAQLLDGTQPERLHLLLERVALRLSEEQVEPFLALPKRPAQVRKRRQERIEMTEPSAADLDWIEQAATVAALQPSERPLLQETLLRRLLSSHEAAAASLARLERFLRRAAEAAAAGGTINRRTFATTFADEREGGPAQLMFPFWYQTNEEPLPPPHELLERAETMAQMGLQALAHPYCRRAATQALRDRLPRAGLTVAFTDHLDTAAAADRAFRSVARTAVWTSRGLQSRHLPIAEPLVALEHLRAAVERGEGPWCLIATSIGAQGHNLQFAGQLFHLDLPWNPARVEQREGRLDRPGGQANIPIVTLAPPAALERRLRLLERLARKTKTAHEAALPLQQTDGPDPWTPLLSLAAGQLPAVEPHHANDLEQLLVALRPRGPWLRRPGRVWQPLSAAQLMGLIAHNPRLLPPTEAAPLAPRATRWLTLLEAESAARTRLAARPAPARLRQAARQSWNDSAGWAEAGQLDSARQQLEPLERWSRADRPAGRKASSEATTACGPIDRAETTEPLTHLWLEASATLLDSLLAERSAPSYETPTSGRGRAAETGIRLNPQT